MFGRSSLLASRFRIRFPARTRIRSYQARLVARAMASAASPPSERANLGVTSSDVESFRENGYLIVRNAVPASIIRRVLDRFDGVWSGQFETGVYPDEWHWREGMSKENVTREICNVWKSDRVLAGVILSSGLGQLACRLMPEWPAVRLAQDDCWHKPPRGGTEVAFHRDSPYISDQFLPRDDNSITVWLALDHVSAETGTLQYIPGSHKWKNRSEPKLAPQPTATATATDAAGASGSNLSTQFHAPGANYKAGLYEMARMNGVAASDVRIVNVEVPAGSLAIHHQDLIHGSGPNTSPDRVRRSIGIHLLRSDVNFKPSGVTYIYGRYKPLGGTRLDEQFFPVVFGNGSPLTTPQRSAWLNDYCPDLLPATP